MNILIKVDSKEGEESTWVTYITTEELLKLKPLLREIKNNNGYFPTSFYLNDEDPKPEILYSGFEGWNILKGRLPTPTSGFKRITEIHVYDNPISLYM